MRDDVTVIEAYNKYGVQMFETEHYTPGSFRAEVEACKERMKKGEIAWIAIYAPRSAPQLIYA